MIVERTDTSLLTQIHAALTERGWRLHEKINGPTYADGVAQTALYWYVKPSELAPQLEQLILQVYADGKAVELFSSVTYSTDIRDLLDLISEHARPTRPRDQLQKFHDLLFFATTEHAARYRMKDLRTMSSVLLVLCWVLCHGNEHDRDDSIDALFASLLGAYRLERKSSLSGDKENDHVA